MALCQWEAGFLADAVDAAFPSDPQRGCQAVPQRRGSSFLVCQGASLERIIKITQCRFLVSPESATANRAVLAPSLTAPAPGSQGLDLLVHLSSSSTGARYKVPINLCNSRLSQKGQLVVDTTTTYHTPRHKPRQSYRLPFPGHRHMPPLQV